jgi:hypothetical protein
MIPKRTDATPDLFGVSLVQVTHLNHPLSGWPSESIGMSLGDVPPFLRGLRKGKVRQNRQLEIANGIPV